MSWGQNYFVSTDWQEILPPKMTKNRNFQENRQPSGRVCESACQSDTCVLFMAKKPSGNYLDGSGEHNRMN